VSERRPIAVVRLIVEDASGRVLILRRAAGTAGEGTWVVPGGKIDYGDTVEQTAARELSEETGLRAANLRFLFYQDDLPRDGSAHCVTLYLACTAEGTLSVNGESSEAKWIAPADLASLTFGPGSGEALRRYWPL